MQLRYMGFDQTKAVRIYRFDSIVDRAPAVRYIVAVDLTLFLKHHVGIQEGPSLCARKLASDLETVQQREHTLTSEDLLAYVTARLRSGSAQGRCQKTGRPPPRSGPPRCLGKPSQRSRRSRRRGALGAQRKVGAGRARPVQSRLCQPGLPQKPGR